MSEDDEDSIAFVERRGFVEVDRIIELALDLEGSESPPRPPAGIQIAEVTEARYRQAYEVFAAGVGDIPTAGPAPTSSLDSWLAEVRESPLTLIALDGDRVVGYADLEVRNAEAGLLGNNLTTVARSHRRRGIAEALKRAQIAWAREHGYRRLVTATHATNEPMQRLNEKLGYRPLPATIDVSRRLGA